MVNDSIASRASDPVNVVRYRCPHFQTVLTFCICMAAIADMLKSGNHVVDVLVLLFVEFLHRRAVAVNGLMAQPRELGRQFCTLITLRLLYRHSCACGR